MEKIKEILFVLMPTAAILSGLVWLSGFVQNSSSGPGVSGRASSVLAAVETQYDFGTISMKDGNVSHIFKIANPTGHDVVVQSVVTSCMCTSAYIEGASSEKGPYGMAGMGYVPPVDEIIKAGGSLNIKVVYNPNAHGPAGVGRIDRVIYLTDADGGSVNLGIHAIVTP